MSSSSATRTEPESGVVFGRTVAGCRDTGRVPDPNHLDEASTAASSPMAEFARGILVDAVGYAWGTGAERRVTAGAAK